MGTSSVFGGQGGASPLVPSFVGEAGAPSADDAANAADPDDDGDGTPPPSDPPQPPQRPPVPPNADPTRFTAARNNFSRFASSGGADRASLGRALSHYVGSSTGGARGAAGRMGSAREAGSWASSPTRPRAASPRHCARSISPVSPGGRSRRSSSDSPIISAPMAARSTRGSRARPSSRRSST